MRKGVFIPDITVDMFKNATLESVEEFMTSGQMEDIEIPDRPHGECKIYHARFEDRIACKCGFMKVITGHWDDYNYCQRCGRKAVKEGEKRSDTREDG